jgi:hypothetical protein
MVQLYIYPVFQILSGADGLLHALKSMVSLSSNQVTVTGAVTLLLTWHIP